MSRDNALIHGSEEYLVSEVVEEINSVLAPDDPHYSLADVRRVGGPQGVFRLATFDNDAVIHRLQQKDYSSVALATAKDNRDRALIYLSPDPVEIVTATVGEGAPATPLTPEEEEKARQEALLRDLEAGNESAPEPPPAEGATAGVAPEGEGVLPEAPSPTEPGA